MVLKSKSNEDEFWDVCKGLLGNENETVKLWAAIFYLKKDEQKAKLILEEIKCSPKIVGLTAASFLDMWKKVC